MGLSKPHSNLVNASISEQVGLITAVQPVELYNFILTSKKQVFKYKTLSRRIDRLV